MLGGNSRAIEKKKNITVPQVGFVHAEDVLKTQEVITGHLTRGREPEGEGGSEGAREKKTTKCHYWFGVETEQAAADLQLTAAATRNKKKEEKQKTASDCDPGVNRCSSH